MIKINIPAEKITTAKGGIYSRVMTINPDDGPTSEILLCDRCGALIGNPANHDRWCNDQ